MNQEIPDLTAVIATWLPETQGNDQPRTAVIDNISPSRQNVTTNKTLPVVLSLFKRVLFSPDDNLSSLKKRGKERIPIVVASQV
jgi:hypothetical protein